MGKTKYLTKEVQGIEMNVIDTIEWQPFQRLNTSSQQE